MLHNEYLDEIFNNFDCEAVNLDEEMWDQSIDLLNSFTMASEVYYEIIDYVDDSFDIQVYDKDFSEFVEVSGFYNDIIDTIHAGVENEDSFSEIEADIESIEYAASIKLGDCIDLSFILGVASVAKASTYYWLPTIDGGLGNLHPCSGSSLRRPGWLAATIAGDVGGLAGGFMRIGILGALGMGVPGTNAILVTGLAVGAGIASGLALAAHHH